MTPVLSSEWMCHWYLSLSMYCCTWSTERITSASASSAADGRAAASG